MLQKATYTRNTIEGKKGSQVIVDIKKVVAVECIETKEGIGISLHAVNGIFYNIYFESNEEREEKFKEIVTYLDCENTDKVQEDTDEQ